MEQQEPGRRKPSLLFGGLVGYAMAIAIATVFVILKMPGAAHYHEKLAYQFFVPAGGLGAYLGYRFAVKRRRTLGVSEPADGSSSLDQPPSRFLQPLFSLARWL